MLVYRSRNHGTDSRECCLSGKFEVHIIDSNDILGFKTWHPQFYKKSFISAETRGKNFNTEQKVHFSIHKLYHFEYENKNKGYIRAYTNINGLIHHTFFMAKTTGAVTGPYSVAYPTGKLRIKQTKMDDLKKLRNYIPQSYQ